MTNNPVLVFDLDGTIAGDYVNFREDRHKDLESIQINPRLLHILRLADKARKSQQIDAILLLTNNSDIFYVFMVQYILGKLVAGVSRATINKGNTREQFHIYNFFDDIMTRNDNRRPFAADGNPPKRLVDVKTMVEGLDVSTENLESRIWFFDDRDDHEIRNELLPGSHYIHITPSYTEGVKDRTDLREVERILSPPVTSGGNPPSRRGCGCRKRSTRSKKKQSRRKRYTRKGSLD
jgi:hypothetical protein